MTKARAVRRGGNDGLAPDPRDDEDLLGDAGTTAIPPRTSGSGLADASTVMRHPADARTVYLKAITPLTAQTGDKVYDQMAKASASARACHEALGTLGEFRSYLAVLRASQKRKRNLMKILADNGL